MNRATLIKKLEDFRGEAGLYKMEPPLERHEYVVVSAVTVPSYRDEPLIENTETYIFPANESGEVTDWIELRGSLRDTLSHRDALTAAGYELE
jgi:hypothetical protein